MSGDLITNACVSPGLTHMVIFIKNIQLFDTKKQNNVLQQTQYQLLVSPGLTVWATVLYSYANIYGFWSWFIYYFIPLFIFSSYMVIITFLHHSEVNTPWYADSQWDFVKGQLSTIDRDYGPVHYIIHSIGTHQVNMDIQIEIDRQKVDGQDWKITVSPISLATLWLTPLQTFYGLLKLFKQFQNTF